MSTVDSMIKIGIVDDHTLFRQGLTQILKSFENIDVIFEAASCQELLSLLQFHQPQVILMDLQMPDSNGMEGCKLVLEQYPEVKIIILSMHSSDNFIFHMMKAGARSYLPKDIDQHSLKEAIEEVFTKGLYFTEKIAKAMLRGVKSSSKAKPTFQSSYIPLTQREQEVLALICLGHTTNEIADKLFISVRTVEGHRKNLLEKTGTQNSVSLAVYAIHHNLVENNRSIRVFE